MSQRIFGGKNQTFRNSVFLKGSLAEKPVEKNFALEEAFIIKPGDKKFQQLSKYEQNNYIRHLFLSLEALTENQRPLG